MTMGETGRLAVLFLALGATASGCATGDSNGCWTEECRVRATNAAFERDRQQAPAPPTECEIAEANPATAAPAVVQRCRAARWQASRIACSDRRISTFTVEVTCSLPVPADFSTSFEKSIQLAAFAALSAGRTGFVMSGDDLLQGQYEDSTTPVQCEQKNRALYALASGLRASQPSATTTCRPGFSGSVVCDTHEQAPLPPPAIECTGGTATSRLVSIITHTRFELLTAEEAARAENPNLPAARQPWSAGLVAQAFAGLR
jgi:hypothetical protein